MYGYLLSRLDQFRDSKKVADQVKVLYAIKASVTLNIMLCVTLLVTGAVRISCTIIKLLMAVKEKTQ